MRDQNLFFDCLWLQNMTNPSLEQCGYQKQSFQEVGRCWFGSARTDDPWSQNVSCAMHAAQEAFDGNWGSVCWPAWAG